MKSPNTEPAGGTWRRLLDKLITPRVDDARLAEALARTRQQQPPPVLWLVGKTQSGKTSIIRALTASPSAEIGTGYTPCTRTTRLYDFPAEAPLVRFLDTRGLGEVGYDPTADIHYGESLARLVVAVMKVTDAQQDDLYNLLAAVRKRHSAWPLLMVQTCLHEAHSGVEHTLPYPFHRQDWELQVPDNLRRALITQRARFARLPGSGPISWTPVDFTLPEDRISPADYGLEALWQAVESAAALELQSLLHGDTDLRDVLSRAAHPHIMGYTLAAAGLGALPVVDLALVPALQMKLLHTLAAIYQQPWTSHRVTEFFGMLGVSFMTGYGLRWAGRGLVKLVPGWGQTAGAVWGATSSAAITYALGRAAGYYLSRRREGQTVDGADLRAVYEKALAYGKTLLSRHRGR